MSAAYLQSLFSLEGQTAVVIGGTGVLGGAICDCLGQAGARVVVAGRSEDRGARRVQELLDRGAQASYRQVDVSSRESIVALRQYACDLGGGVDLLVNCAGVNSAVPYEQISDEQWRQVIDGNLWATHCACQVFAPSMAEQAQGGSILNIGSITAHIPLSRVFAYAASKAAVVNLTKNLAREYAQRGVRVNVLCPGFFPAEQNRKILDQERIENILRQTPMQRFGEPHELAGAVLLLLSPAAGSFMTGAEIYVDGGFTAMRF